jgi:serine/threonine protein phosphatase PrpC
MGATLVGVLVEGTRAHVASVGDSRAYLIRAGAIAPLTEDQSLVNMLVRSGVLTRDEASRSTRRNVLLQALGHGDPIVVATARLELRDGDLILLCTDGLTNLVDDDEILAGSREVPASRARANTLSNSRFRAGARTTLRRSSPRSPARASVRRGQASQSSAR